MTKLIFKYLLILLIFFNFIFQASSENKDKNKFKKEEIVDKAKIYFADLSEGVAIIVERSFSDFGLPSAYIEGEEFSAAFFGGTKIW